MRFLILLLFSVSAQACTLKDKWTGPDKLAHAQAGAMIGLVGGMNNGNWLEGAKWAAIVGGVKEITDQAGMGQCSAKDFLATVAGGVIGGYTGAKLAVWKQDRTVMIGVNVALR